MKILHVVPGLNERGNGIAVAVRLIAKGQQAAGHEVELVETRNFVGGQYAEIWVHSNWWLPTLWACWKVIRAGAPLVRMTHANLDPLRYRSKGWKKRLVSPLERWLYRHTARVVVTCEAERRWCEDWGVRCKIELINLKQFFNLEKQAGGEIRWTEEKNRPLHVLYLGRRHPLKGTRYLERAIAGLKGVELREVSDHFDAELEEDWRWADVLCLPTLSENFGLVVAEALVRDKVVITTDGAPAWEGQSGVTYLKGYRDGGDAARVQLLKEAIAASWGTNCAARGCGFAAHQGYGSA